MENLEILKGKRLLIVDDETDVLDTLSELLDMCLVDRASDFKTARALMEANKYDAAIFDIMGVNGYDLLEISNKKKIPALMFTAHALSPDDFVKSMEGGAKAYIPKEKMSEIAGFVADLIRSHLAGEDRPKKWFERLRSFFNQRFGEDWIKDRQAFWDKNDWLFPPGE